MGLPEARQVRRRRARPRRSPKASVGLAGLLACLVATIGTVAVHATSSPEADLAWDFEDGSTEGWYASPGAELSIAHAGYESERAARLANVSSQSRTIALNDRPDRGQLMAGHIYRATALVRASSPDMSVGLRIAERDAAGYVDHAQRSVWLTDDQWTTLEVEYTVGRNGNKLDLNVIVWRAGVGEAVLVDDVTYEHVGASAGAENVVAPTQSPSATVSVPSASATFVPVDPTLPPTSPPAEPTVEPTTPSVTPEPTATGGVRPGVGATETCGAMARLAPACGALWGIYTLAGDDPASSVRDLEAQVGRKFDVTLRFHDFSHSFPGQFPDRYEYDLGQDRILFLSWQAQVYSTQTGLQWSEIAAGKYDADYVVPAAQRVKQYGKPMFIAFDAEFDLRLDKGTPGEYVAAFRHVHDVFEREGVTNVVWVWISTGYLGAGNADIIKAGYPGDNYVDWVGYDPYNFYQCNGSDWKTFEWTIERAYTWLMNEGFGDKPFFLSEYGTQFDESDPGRSTEWQRSIGETLTKYPNIKGLARFDSNTCQMRVNNGPGMLSAFAEAGQHPHVNVGPGR